MMMKVTKIIIIIMITINNRACNNITNPTTTTIPMAMAISNSNTFVNTNDTTQQLYNMMVSTTTHDGRYRYVY
jgi:hypothetical protein